MDKPAPQGEKSEPNYASRRPVAVLLAVALALLAAKGVKSGMEAKSPGIPDDFVDHTPKPEEFLRHLLNGHPEIERAIAGQDWKMFDKINLADMNAMKERFGDTITIGGYQLATDAFVDRLHTINAQFDGQAGHEARALNWVKSVQPEPVPDGTVNARSRR